MSEQEKKVLAMIFEAGFDAAMLSYESGMKVTNNLRAVCTENFIQHMENVKQDLIFKQGNN